MSAISLRVEAGAMLGFLERQRNATKRFWAWEVVWFVYSLVSVMSIGYLATGLRALGGSSSTVDIKKTQLYLLAGSVLWSYLSLVFMEVTHAIGWERWEGTIEYTFMSPVRRTTHLLGVCFFAVLYGFIRTAVVVAITGLAFHIDLSHANLLTGAVALLVATFPLIGIAVLIAVFPLLAPEKGEQMSTALQGILLLVSGVYYPISVLPAVLRWMGDISPLTYTLSTIRRSLIDDATVGDLLRPLGALLLIGAIMIPLSLQLFAAAERRAKRQGLLKRSG